jgi:hypothetical protein
MASACIVFVFAACGGGTLSLTEYSELFQSASFAVTDEFDVLGAQWASATTVEEGKEILDRVVAIRTDLQNSLTDLDPPEALADFHGDFVELLGRILAATEAVAVRAETAGSLDELKTSSEALAYWDLDAQIFQLCLGIQSKLDATAERELFAEVPWIPGEMKEVVSLVVCPPFSITVEQTGVSTSAPPAASTTSSPTTTEDSRILVITAPDFEEIAQTDGDIEVCQAWVEWTHADEFHVGLEEFESTDQRIYLGDQLAFALQDFADCVTVGWGNYERYRQCVSEAEPERTPIAGTNLVYVGPSEATLEDCRAKAVSAD